MLTLIVSKKIKVLTASPESFLKTDVLRLPELNFLDLRFNELEGTIPRKHFDKDLDRFLINHKDLSLIYQIMYGFCDCS
jgi:hypothetical protein